MERRNFMKSILAGGGTAILVSKGYSLKFFPNPSKNKWAILFGTRYGSNRDASIWISEGMGAIADVYDARENPDLSSFDYLIVGSGIYGGRIAQPLESYLSQNVSSISSKIKAVFVVCGAGGSERASQYLDQLAKLCEANPPLEKSFSGRLTKRLLSPDDFKGLESFYQRGNRPFEDYDNLQRKDCLQFGEDILKQFSTIA
ncbi:MAG: flavodoxin domain-containing protein [Candidatus Aminicenantes bacterium]|nr:flavodoxin domain-containing protein [Candidatus Aminicenantes bacterium]